MEGGGQPSSLTPDVHPPELDYSLLFRSSSVMFAVTDRTGRLLSVNPAWQRTLGRTLEELVGRPVGELIHPEDRAAARLALEESTRTGRPARLVNRTLAADGSYRELEWQASVVGDWVYATAVDVSDRESERRELRRGDARHRALFELSTQGVIYLDGQGRLIEANPAAPDHGPHRRATAGPDRD